VVDLFVELSAKNGVDIFRIFDALNDISNVKCALQAVKKAGKHAQGGISYTTSPVHTTESFVLFARELKDLGCDSICIKDMSGIIMPGVAYELVKILKKDVGLPVALHSHCTAGIAPMAYQAASDAGVDVLDCAISPLGGGAAQPHTESMAYALKDTDEDTGVNYEALFAATEFFREIRERYNPLIDSISERVDTRVLTYQIPGGMLSNLISQLKSQKKLVMLEEVLAEVPRVRKECGYPPLVTPTSQIVGVQAVFNVLMGRYKIVSNETKNLIRGGYGRTPAPIDPAFQKEILKGMPIIEGRPADHLEPELDKLRSEFESTGLIKTPEDLLTIAMNPSVGKAFLAGVIKAEKAPWEEGFSSL
jgi:pyruvate carboxylase subunit B